MGRKRRKRFDSCVGGYYNKEAGWFVIKSGLAAASSQLVFNDCRLMAAIIALRLLLWWLPSTPISISCQVESARKNYKLQIVEIAEKVVCDENILYDSRKSSPGLTVDRRLSRNDTAEGEILLKVRLRHHHRRRHLSYIWTWFFWGYGCVFILAIFAKLAELIVSDKLGQS